MSFTERFERAPICRAFETLRCFWRSCMPNVFAQIKLKKRCYLAKYMAESQKNKDSGNYRRRRISSLMRSLFRCIISHGKWQAACYSSVSCVFGNAISVGEG